MTARETAALMVATPTERTRERLDQLLDIKYPQPALPALRFESIVAYAHDGTNVVSSRVLDETDMVHADTRFKEFADEHSDHPVEMFGRKWEWAGGALECLYSLRRPQDTDVLTLAEEAFQVASVPVATPR